MSSVAKYKPLNSFVFSSYKIDTSASEIIMKMSLVVFYFCFHLFIYLLCLPYFCFSKLTASLISFDPDVVFNFACMFRKSLSSTHFPFLRKSFCTSFLFPRAAIFSSVCFFNSPVGRRISGNK